MRHQAGFTLLEVLVAFVMLGAVGTSLFQLYQGGLRNLHSSEERTHAALLARSRLSELRAVDRLTAGTFEGDLEGAYRWRLNLTDFEDSSEPTDFRSSMKERPLLFIADLRIEWGEPGEAKVFKIRTLLRARQEQPS